MSRVGKTPIAIPKGVEAKVINRQIHVKGPKGTLEREIDIHTDVTIENGELVVTLKEEHSDKNQFHGLMRALINNMIIGVVDGFKQNLLMIGVGYRAAVKGNDLDIQVGRSHPTLLPIPKDLKVTVEKNTTIIIEGADKQRVGQFAANVRSQRPPEVYQGKGIRKEGEYVRKKQGKSAAK
jgi:large subunit ribosomal protein L6